MFRKYSALVFFSFILSLLITTSTFGQRDSKRFKERYPVHPDKIFRVKIEIDAGEVNIHKSPREREARVIVYYDDEDYKIVSDFDKKRSLLVVEFDKKHWSQSNDDIAAEAIIELPAGVDIDLEAKIKAGEVEIDFAGLALLGLELTTWAGEVTVEFSEPNHTEMDFLEINTKIGETEIIKLGNARFKDAEINGGIGEMRVDFRGQLLTEARADIDLDIGETTLVLPQDTGIKMSVSKFLFMTAVDLPRRFRKSGRYYYSRNFDEAETQLALKVSPGLGELKVDY
ncbi:MAG: hypothetical protein ACE5IR_00595 [bacterium]